MTNKALLSGINRAKQHRIMALYVRSSEHFGTAIYHTKIAADAGCAGFLSSNASPSMAPLGGVGRLVDNNP